MRRFVIILSTCALAFAGVACGDDDNGDGSAEAFCDRLEGLQGSLEPPDDDTLDALADDAPSEIRDDVRTLVDLDKELRDDPEAFDFEPSEAQTDAADRVDTYINENCDLPDLVPEGEAPEIDLEDLEDLDLEDLDLEGIEIEDVDPGQQDPQDPNQ